MTRACGISRVLCYRGQEHRSEPCYLLLLTCHQTLHGQAPWTLLWALASNPSEPSLSLGRHSQDSLPGMEWAATDHLWDPRPHWIGLFGVTS